MQIVSLLVHLCKFCWAWKHNVCKRLQRVDLEILEYATRISSICHQCRILVCMLAGKAHCNYPATKYI